ATVGHLYRSIERGFADLAAKLGEEQLFAGPPQAQATQADFGWPELVAVTDVASAQRAIDEILEQGEGPRGHWKDAHFGQFVAILDEFEQLSEANPGFDPVRAVIPVNVRPSERAITDPPATHPTPIADALAVHLPARYAPEPPAPAGDPASLLARAEDYYRTGQAFAVADDPARSGVAALLTSAYPAALRADPRTLARLVNSVL